MLQWSGVAPRCEPCRARSNESRDVRQEWRVPIHRSPILSAQSRRLYSRYLCSRDALGQARRATIGYLVYKAGGWARGEESPRKCVSSPAKDLPIT